jgi:hypothetical protein
MRSVRRVRDRTREKERRAGVADCLLEDGEGTGAAIGPRNGEGGGLIPVDAIPHAGDGVVLKCSGSAAYVWVANVDVAHEAMLTAMDLHVRALTM